MKLTIAVPVIFLALGYLNGCALVYKHSPPVPPTQQEVKDINVNVEVTLTMPENKTPVVSVDKKVSTEKITPTKVYINKPVCKELKDLYNYPLFELSEISVNTETDRLNYLGLLVDRIVAVDQLIVGARENGECEKNIRR